MVARHSAKMMRWSTVGPIGASDPVISPVDFGADPTGNTDSSDAFDQVLQALLKKTSGNTVLDNGIADLQGATVDLGGGAYLLSRPFKIPAFVGNMRMIQGSLRASPSFPRHGYLIEVGDATSCSNGQGSCNVNVGLQGLSLDASQVAAGGAIIYDTMGAVFGPQNYVVNFTAAGLNVTGGHEVMVTQSWFGEFLYSDKRKENGTASTAVGVQLNGNDHIVSDVIVYSSKVGLHVNGGANLATAVHTWNLATGNGGTGILVTASQVRLTSVYLDWNDLVIEDPGLFSVSESFFLCGGRIVLKAGSSGSVSGFYAVGNQFVNSYCQAQGSETIVTDESVAAFSDVHDVTLSGNMYDRTGTKLTVKPSGVVITKSVASTTPTTSWSFDFTPHLLFNASNVPIQSISYSIVTDAPHMTAMVARPATGGVVTVETAQAVTGTVTITVDQSQRSL